MDGFWGKRDCIVTFGAKNRFRIFVISLLMDESLPSLIMFKKFLVLIRKFLFSVPIGTLKKFWTIF